MIVLAGGRSREKCGEGRGDEQRGQGEDRITVVECGLRRSTNSFGGMLVVELLLLPVADRQQGGDSYHDEQQG